MPSLTTTSSLGSGSGTLITVGGGAGGSLLYRYFADIGRGDRFCGGLGSSLGFSGCLLHYEIKDTFHIN